MSERNPKRFETVTNAQSRSPEEQQRLLEESDRERYEAFMAGGEDDFDKATANREAQAYDEYAETESRIMEDVDTRRMYMLAQQVAELRDNGAEPEIIADKENLLQELLLNYTDKAYADRDLGIRNAEINATSTPKGKEREEAEKRKAEEDLAPKIKAADFILNSTDSAWVKENMTAPGSKEAAPDEDVDKDRVKDMEEARVLADIEELTRAIKSDPEAAEAAGVYDKLRDVMAQIDAALVASKEKEALKEPKDGDLKDDDEVLKEPKDGTLDDELKEPKDGDLDDDAVLKEPKDGTLDDEALKEPKDGDLSDKKDDGPEKDGDTKELDKVSNWRHPFNYVATLFVIKGGDLMERFRSSDKKKTIAVVGAVAILGGLIAGRHYGWFGGGGGHHNDAANGFTPGQKGGHPGGTGIETSPVVPKGPEVPSADNYAHPWNWMKAAMDNGSVTPPKGMGPEQALHYYGEKVAATGHKVEWYKLPSGLEAIRIDGNDDTQFIGDLIGQQFAK